MDKKTTVSRSRQKRTQKRTREHTRKTPPLSGKLILCYFLLLAALLFTLNLGRGIIVTDLTPGQLAPATVQALVDFQSVDLAETELARERAGAQVPPVLAVREQPLSKISRTLDTFFTHLAKLRKENGNAEEPQSPDMAWEEALELMGLGPELAAFPDAFPAEAIPALQTTLIEQLQRCWNSGMISERERESGFQGSIPLGAVRLSATGPVLPLMQFPTPEEAAKGDSLSIGEKLDLNREQVDLLTSLLASQYEPNLLIDRVATREAREKAVEETDPVKVLRRKDTTLMEARTQVTEQTLEDLRAHDQKLLELDEEQNQLSRLFGEGLYLAVGLAISLAFLYLLENPSFRKTNRLFLWVILTEGSLLLGQFLIYLSSDLHLFPGHFLRPLLPLAIAPMLGTILYGPRLGLAVGLSSSLAHALQHDMDLSVFFCGMALTLTAAISVRAIHRRSSLFRAGLWIGGMKAVVMIGAGTLELIPWVMVAQQSLVAFSTGLFAALMVLLLISPFEFMFKVTTDIRLLELSDMSHPLLSRLAMEAPGTYHHSLMVAHLAQAAAREIGANDMLVRVCAYYHDIGKMTKPEFFIENSQGRQNPHDELSPSMSRLLIISHVKEGVSLARRYKLPAVIVDGIEQHHGTSVIQYFYHRARTLAEEEEKNNVEPEHYRYPGPKPHSREMGILMMADTIEAASRTIDKNKPGQVEGLVREIIREKLNDGQFDHCDLTVGEINAARRSFVFSLKNMLHGRVEYPKEGAEDAGSSEAPEESSIPEESHEG